MSVSVRVYNDLREEISVLQGLIEQARNDGLPARDERLLQVYVETLHRRQELLEDLEQAELEG